MAEFVRVAKVGDVPSGEGRVVIVGEKEIALFRVGDAYHAIGNTCLHQGGPLGEGWIDGRIVSCPWHGWTYDVTTGACTLAPGAQVPSYPVKVEGDDIYVAL